MTRSIRFTLGFLTLLALAAPAQAQQRKGGPTLVVAASNATAATEASKGAVRSAVRPNDVLRYTLTFSNPTEHSVAKVELRNPIPDGVVFVPGSAKASRADARLEFSADNGKSWAAQPTETVVLAGQQVTRAIPVNRYTHIRWVVKGSVEARGVITAEFEAKVAGAGA
jgi:uncharacterized repeat protein (TIGR01451 family)